MSIEKFKNYQGVPKQEIPKIALYMDQVVSWFEEVLEPWLISDQQKSDKPLTKAMINNYVKAKLVPSPEKKKYSPEQLMQLLMIYQLKNVLSIDDLKMLLSAERIENMYDDFMQMEQFLLSELRDDGVYKSIENASEEAKKRYAMQLALEANLKKKLSEEIIQTLRV